MPAQQSNISAEDLDDDEGRTKEIPRQSVLSNLVGSSISNFENEDESGEDGEGENGANLDAVVASKDIIRIERQGTQAAAAQNKPNLRKQRSNRKAEPVVVNLEATL